MTVSEERQPAWIFPMCKRLSQGRDNVEFLEAFLLLIFFQMKEWKDFCSRILSIFTDTSFND